LSRSEQCARVVGNVVMMLGAQRTVLVPFRFPVFGVKLWKGSYLAAQAQGPFPSDVNFERSCLGPARTILIYQKKILTRDQMK